MRKGNDMQAKPIIFNGDMVRAILDGRKTQTRRVVRGQSPNNRVEVKHGGKMVQMHVTDARLSCPHGQPGDLLWVRETFTKTQHGLPVYKSDAKDADGKYWPSVAFDKEGVIWTPSIHMPRWASRITLEITDVRVELLQDISEMDARAEGVKPSKRAIGPDEAVSCWWDYLRNEPNYLSSRDSFASLWQSIYGDWDTNPWVWVIEFKPHLKNVDEMLKG